MRLMRHVFRDIEAQSGTIGSRKIRGDHGGRGSHGGGRMRLMRNGTPSLVKAPESVMNLANVGSDDGCPRVCGCQEGSTP